MASHDERLCLQWNDFKDNVSSAFGDLREDKDFTDVTLACEDGQQVEAHKVVLIASSPFFLNILKKSKHAHPLIYIKGVKYEDLVVMVDFFYRGEAKVFQENFDSFLVLAEEFQLKGLRGNQTENESSQVFPPPAKKEDPSKQQTPKAAPKPYHHLPVVNKDASIETGILQTTIEAGRAVVFRDHLTNSTNIESLKQQVKSMMIFSDKAEYPYKQNGVRARACKVCGKEGGMVNIMNHIESNHITGISIPCDTCGKAFKSRNSLNAHKSQQHRKNQ